MVKRPRGPGKGLTLWKMRNRFDPCSFSRIHFYIYEKLWKFSIQPRAKREKGSCFSASFSSWLLHVSRKYTISININVPATEIRIQSGHPSDLSDLLVTDSYDRFWSAVTWNQNSQFLFSKSVWIWKFIARWGVYRLFEQDTLSKFRQKTDDISLVNQKHTSDWPKIIFKAFQSSWRFQFLARGWFIVRTRASRTTHDKRPVCSVSGTRTIP